MSRRYVVLWKQEKRLCFWMAVLAVYEHLLARGQNPAPREGRLMTASHGKALQQEREKGGIEWDREDKEKGGRLENKGEKRCFEVGVIG